MYLLGDCKFSQIHCESSHTYVKVQDSKVESSPGLHCQWSVTIYVFLVISTELYVSRVLECGHIQHTVPNFISLGI